ncbi:MAG: hypothetical protein H6727_08025 [Myxococcales bacterium]|nr:hypothetical protein [Myxococcales bacterium]
MFPHLIRIIGLVVMVTLGTQACNSTPPSDVCGGNTFGPCPTNAQCKKVILAGTKDSTFVCVQVQERSSIGGLCEGNASRCQEDLFCYAPDSRVAESYCTRTCAEDKDCPQGYNCGPFGNSKACIRSQATKEEGCRCQKAGTSCTKNGHNDCAIDEGYFCLSNGPQDPNAICIKECDPTYTQACAEGFFCSQDATGRNLCVKEAFTRQEMGGSCKDYGKAECKEDLFCYSQYDSDPYAYCSKRCSPYDSGSCPARFVCESPNIEDPFFCIPRGTKDLGDDCSQEGYRVCRSGFCARPDRSSSDAFCTQRCDPSQDDCPQGFSCRLFANLYRYLCDRAQAGSIGTICNKNGDADCLSKICIAPQQGTINRICSQTCDAQKPCPSGWKCDGTRQLCLPDSGTGQIGDPCTQPADCLLGNCVTNAAGKSFCTQTCQDSIQCPSGFTCQDYANGRFCLPATTQSGQVGDACPNGAGDCASSICVTDVLKNRTFCTEQCGTEKACPVGFKCYETSPGAGFCTPPDYQAP